jgi:hypothetical protein
MSSPNHNVTDMHREVSLSLLRGTSAYAVRTPRGQKDPGHFGWDPITNSPSESQKTLHLLERNDDNLGIHLHGSVIDVDVDTDNPTMIAALDHFLPYTAHTWGRKSRPRTHRLYEILVDGEGYRASQYPFLSTLSKHPDINVEIRGGEAKSGQYSLLPGSVHPSGETYEWSDPKAARSTPATVDLMKIIDGVRFAAVVATLAPYWTEGSRNSMCMAFSGFLYRAVSHSEDIAERNPVSLDKERALNVLKGLLRVTGDDGEDYSMRIQTFEKTWAKGDAGDAVKGGATLAKLTGNDKLLPLLYQLLVASENMLEFDEFLDRYAVRNNTSNVIDRTKAGYRGSVSIMTVHDFRNSNMHKCLITADGARVLMTNLLLTSQRAIRVDGMGFRPDGEDIYEWNGGRHVNQWRGFAIPRHTQPVTDDDVRPFLSYVDDIIARKDKRIYDWVMAWLADIIKFPASKCGTALVLVGKPGAGKSFLGQHIMRKIIGRNHSMQTNNIASITGNFNQDSANMLMIQCDEALNSRRREDALRLKSLITDEVKRVEPKGIDAYQLEDWARYLFTSNDVSEAVAIVDGQDDRRYTVVHVSDDYAARSELNPEDKNKFWLDMHTWAEDETNLAKVHRYLYDMVYDRRSIRVPLDTQARRDTQQHSVRGFDDWLMKMTTYEHPLENLRETEQRISENYVVNAGGKLEATLDEWPEFTTYRRLEESYEMYRRAKGMSGTISSYNAQQIKHEFTKRKLLPAEPASHRIEVKEETWVGEKLVVRRKPMRLQEMPTRQAILAYLEYQYGYKVDQSYSEIEVEPIGGKKGDKF